MDPSTLERSSQGKDPRTFEKKAREMTQAPWREAVKVRESCRMEESPMPWSEEEKEWTVRYTSDGTQSPKIKRITVVGEITKPRKKEKRRMEEGVEEEVKREENKNEDGKEAAEVGILGGDARLGPSTAQKKEEREKRRNPKRRREKGNGGVRNRWRNGFSSW